jgi:capsular exopolysaccharide synthesis family protein
MDNTVTNPEQVAGFLSLPTLATVPTIGWLDDRTYVYKPALPLNPAWSNGNYPAANVFPSSLRKLNSETPEKLAPREAFRSLSTSMLFSDTGLGPTTVLVTSAQPGEGKTLVATNLAVALAELGKPVLLIDADMRRPKIHRAFGVRCGSGLAGYLEGGCDWRGVVQKTGVEGLDILGCGGQHPNPVQLLSSKRVPTLLAEAAKEYKYIILDSPPVLNLADGRILAHLVEGVILVVKSGATPLVLVQRADSYIRGAGAKINGVVLNNFNFANDAYYSGQRHPVY